MKQLKIANNYYLISQPLNEGAVKIEIKKKSTNHIIVIDVSGSMSYDLALIRKQLKNKLPNLFINTLDTITIIWFSGRDQAGVLKEEVEVKSLKTLDDLNSAIDRWLQPVGMTAFAKPLILVKESIQRIRKNRPDSFFSMLFLTDGGNNSVPWTDVIKAANELTTELDSSAIIEYGYYCDSQKITELCGILGADKVSCNGFDDYEPVFDKKLTGTYGSGKKKVVYLGGNILYDLVFSTRNDGSVLLYNVNGGSITIGEDVNEIYYFSNLDMKYETQTNETALYAAAYILSDALKNDDAEKVIAVLGDNYYYKLLSEAFGKQKLNAFKSSIKECVADVAKRFPQGRGKIQPIDDNAYCLMDLINDLSTMENCLFYPNHESFNYKRIGRAKVAVGSKLNENDHKKLSEAKNAAEMLKVAQELAENKIDLEFVDSYPERGYALDQLVWNSSRANLSIRVKYDGIAKLPKNKFGIDEVLTYKYRNYTLIKDGILNVTKLPVSPNEELIKLLHKNNVVFEATFQQYGLESDGWLSPIIIDLSSIPIINRGMVKNISANDLALQEWNLLKVQANDKVYKHYRTEWFPKESKSFIAMLGQEQADWLKEIGVTDYNGFNPKVESTPSTDFYMSVNLETKIKGFSSLPPVPSVIAKMKDPKAVLKPVEWLMSGAIKDIAVLIESLQTVEPDKRNAILETYLTNQTDNLNIIRRKSLEEISRIKFSLILSKKWFVEFKSFDENKLDVKFDNMDLSFTFDLSEK